MLVKEGREGFVTPLRTRKNPMGWKISRSYLPFEAGHIQDALVRLLDASAIGLEQSVPELCGFSIEEDLNEFASGSSMHIAGLLSVVDAMNGHSAEEFSCACAVVMPEDDNLSSVDSIDVKLTAFAREYGKASLLVCHPDYEVPETLAECFPESVIWRVDSFAGLAEKLMELDLLSAFTQRPFSTGDLAEARRRLAWFTSERKTGEALKFAERLEGAVNKIGVSGLRVQQAIELELEELNRHSGRYIKAIQHSRSAVELLERLGSVSSFQELLDAKVRLAAALLDGHQFDEGASMLEELLPTVESTSDLFTAESEVSFRNTLGRLKVLRKEDGWETLFRKSLELQKVVDRASIPRTRGYLVHSYLRSGQLEKAERELEVQEEYDLSLIHI